MITRPVLFSGAMVRALLDGSKTQTRRAVKVRCQEIGERDDGSLWPWSENPDTAADHWHACPYGQPGDRLWVRESWKAHTTFDHLPPRDIPESHVWYLADDGYKAQSRTRASMHMPRWASRILLEIVAVRVERLQDISEKDARAEGVTIEERHMAGYCAGQFLPPSIRAYRDLWESISGDGSWGANPWVWVVEFKRVTP